MTTKYRIIGLGELLWDMFPDRRSLGGAPANVAYHASALGDEGVLLTRVGADELGDEAVATLAACGVDVTAVQRDSEHPTGQVTVKVDGAEAWFTIESRAAWVYPVWTAAWEERVSAADVLCFGTLQCASKAGLKVVERAAQAAPSTALRLLDLNLRPPFDCDSTVDAALACANLVKLNEAEAMHLSDRFGEVGIEGAADVLLSRAEIRGVAVTLGARGSAFFGPKSSDYQPPIALAPGRQADPVGAGDAFTAALAYHLVRGRPPAHAADAANRYGAFVASRPGTMPALPEAVRARITAWLRT